ncbi:MAG: deoxyribonuclease V [Terriglobia bacterium]
MKPRLEHRWDLTPQGAARLQLELRSRLKATRDLDQVRTVAGADIALDKAAGVGFAGVIVYSFPALVEVERQSAQRQLTFPYVPGLLVFREGPVLLDALAKLRTDPDLIFFDAHGYSHPRRFGLASHLGVILDAPAVGCAKSLLVGRYEEPGNAPGAWAPLVDGEETIGAVLRTRADVQPVFISVGHRVDLPTAIELALACTDGRRIPKPTREADHYVEQLKRGELRGPAQPGTQSGFSF